VFLILLCRAESLHSNLLWLLGGAAVSYGFTGLAYGVGWAWLTHPAGIFAGLILWGTALGLMMGARTGHPISGALGGAVLSCLSVGTGWLLGHPDPAGLVGISVGLFAGTMNWTGLRPRSLLLARGITLGLFGVTALLVCLFQPELGWDSRPFDSLGGGRSGTHGKEVTWGEGKDNGNISASPAAVPMTFSPDGFRLLNEWDRAVYLWNVPNGRLRDTFRASTNSLLTAGFLGAEPRCVTFENQSGLKDKVPSRVLLQSAESGSVLSSVQLSETKPNVRITAAAGRDRMVLISSDGNEVDLTILPPASTEPSKDKVTAPGTITAAAFSGTRILLGFSDGTIRLVTNEYGEKNKILHETKKSGSAVFQLGFSPSGQFAYALSRGTDMKDYPYSSRSGGGTLMAWNAAYWKDFFTLSPGTGMVTCAAFLLNEQHLLAGTNQGTVQVWNIQNQERDRTYKLNSSFFLGSSSGIKSMGSGIRDLAVSPNGRDIAVSSAETGRILLWRLR
jgi:WD40 repeat protein